jgi:TonB family protein
MHLPPEKQFDSPTSVILEKAVGANCVVRGSYGEFNGALGITISALPLPEIASPGGGYLVNAKVNLTPEMAAHLGEPLESLRPKGSFRESGKAGMTLAKCIKCPSAQFTAAAIKAGLQGTVELMAIVTQEGRAKNIALRKSLGRGLDESAIAAVRDWEFAPALDPDGKPAAVRVKIQCVFHLQK